MKAQNERVVYLGDTNENLHWGWVQFPRLFPMRNGNIGMSVHDEDDSWIARETNDKWLVSEDKGAI